jgi:two-component system phosphate regulon response regulator PhoB
METHPMTSRKTILVVEDDEDILELISYNLAQEKHTVVKAVTGEDAMRLAHRATPDLILLDLMLPEIDGLDVCKRLKADPQTQYIPIIMVTAKGEEADVVTGLELGADDYIPKPFRPKELVARVRAVLRRAGRPLADAGKVIKIHNLEIHPGRREVKVDGRPVELTFTEFQVLHTLVQRPGWVYTRYQIVDAVRGDDYPVTDRSVDVQIVGLRKKLGKASKLVETVRGIGYRFKDAS